MTNAAVVAMSKNYPDLVVFRLCIMGRHLPNHLTGEPMDMGFGAIVMNCKKLRRLAISALLTDKAFYYIGQYGNLALLGLHHFHNMRFLWMSFCRLIVGGASAVLGFFASACSLPFDYVKSQIQKMQPNATGKYSYSGSLDCVLKTWKVGGALKFYTEFPFYCVKIAHYVKGTKAERAIQKSLCDYRARPTTEQNDSFVRSYFKYGMEIGRPTFVPNQDLSIHDY
ncbi:hypothetical protein IFM89_037113 [Coptis chinensis]|uniref:Uncharacterized protein n=1 Tax=Coptis chinensis TaxID=261450 RepID=A0A835HQG9_9MAGN|nr:hypothetical protein IFM89_037113 [Coptis chinensis]